MNPWVVGISLSLAAPAGVEAAATSLAITNVTVVDVRDGTRRPGQTLVIEANRIAEVGAADAVTVPPEAIRVDGAGRFVIPGLADMHVHAAREDRAETFWPLFLAHGVTSAREMGSHVRGLLYWRAEAERRRGDAPRLVWSSPMLDGDPPLHPEQAVVVRTPAEARTTVALMETLGFDFLKIYSGLSRANFLAVAEEARRRGMTMAGEVPAAIPPVEAAAAGMKSFEHLWHLFESCVPGAGEADDRVRTAQREEASAEELGRLRDLRDRLWLKGPEGGCFDRMVATLRAHGTWQCPTVRMNRVYTVLDEDPPREDPRRTFVPARRQRRWDKIRRDTLAEYGPLTAQAWRARERAEWELLRKMAAAGIGILAGSDVGDDPHVYPGDGLHEEMAMLVEAGLSPLLALQAATLGPARYLGREGSLGTVEKGKIADLILLDADPLESIRNVARIHAVVFDGDLLTRSDLDRLLDLARQRGGRGR